MNRLENITTVNLSSDYDFNSLVSMADVLTSLPPCIFSSITSMVNIVVFSRLADPLSRFLFYISIADFMYVLLPIPEAVFTNWCQLAPMCGSYVQMVAFYYIYIEAVYLTSCCAMFSILADIFLSLQRIFMLNNKPYLKNVSVNKSASAFLIFSVAYYMIQCSFFYVGPTGYVYIYRGQSYTGYYLILTEFSQTRFGTGLYIALSVFRIFLVIVLMSILNVITIFYFRVFVKRKANLVKRNQAGDGAEDKATRNLTLMLISLNFCYILGNFVYRILYMIKVTGYAIEPSTLITLTRVGNFMIFTYPGLKIIPYLLFNTVYLNRFCELFGLKHRAASR